MFKLVFLPRSAAEGPFRIPLVTESEGVILIKFNLDKAGQKPQRRRRRHANLI